MKILSRDELRNQLKNSEVAPLYLLFGTEKYLRNLASKAITEKILHDSPLREFNETEASLNDMDFVQAISAAEQIPMISPRRVVKITDINRFVEEDEDALQRYVSNPADFSTVIFIADELDKRRRFAKILLEKCVSVEFSNLSDGDLFTWAKAKVKELKAEADERVIKHIVSLVGSDVSRLTNEIEKLAVAALPDSHITNELVEQLVPNSREISNFDLTDQMLAGSRTKAIQTLRKILNDGGEPIMLLGLIASNYRKLFLAKELMSQGVDRKEVARVAGVPFFKQDDFLAVARRTEKEKLSWSIKRIAKADLSIKTSKATPRLQIEMLVTELSA